MNEYNPLIFEIENIKTDAKSMIFSLIVIICSLIINLVIARRIRKTATEVQAFSNIIKSVFYVQIFFCLRLVFSFVDYYIWYYTNGQYSLNGVYESLVWVPILLYASYMIYKRRLIQLPKRRNIQRLIIVGILGIFIVYALISVLLLNLQEDSQIQEITFWIILGIFVLVITSLLYIEFAKINKGVNKIRLNLMTAVFLSLTLYLISLVVLYGAIPTLFPDGIVSGSYHSILIIIITGIPLITAYCFFWMIHIPRFIRKRYSISRKQSHTVA